MNSISKKISIIFSGAVLFLITLIFCEYNQLYADITPVNTEALIRHGIDSADKLMIAAHPDDETIWGGGHLMDRGYFVVVITNGKNHERRSEFENVIESSGNSGMILDYPDKNFGFRSRWNIVRDDIYNDLEKIINYKKWDLIVTHNEKGEYGHQHHIMTHRTVTDIIADSRKNRGTPLYLFGRYYKKADIVKQSDSIPEMPAERVRYKEELLKLYGSQKNTIKKLSHMNCYEDWTEIKNDTEK